MTVADKHWAQCLSATVTEPSQAALVMRFKAMANQRGLSVQKLLLEAVKAFLETEGSS